MKELIKKIRILRNFLDKNIDILSEEELELFLDVLEILKDKVVKMVEDRHFVDS